MTVQEYIDQHHDKSEPIVCIKHMNGTELDLDAAFMVGSDVPNMDVFMTSHDESGLTIIVL